jgi:prepilin-type processing-associated H-X9-DG protein
MNGYLGGDPEVNPKYKFTQLIRPDNTFVFIEEHESSRWHSSFLVPPPAMKGRISAASSAVWLSTPSDRHAQGCNITFADGHVEYWRWYGAKLPSAAGPRLSGLATPAETHDIVRLQSCLP